MPTIEPSRVFISYARKDGAELAQRLQCDLANGGFDAWLDTQRIGGGAVWSTEIEHEIDTREVTIALLSPGSYASEICRAEQLRALDKGNRVIPVLAVKVAFCPAGNVCWPSEKSNTALPVLSTTTASQLTVCGVA